MKKLLKKEHKDKSEKEDKKERKEREKREKKEKKKEEKLAKKGHSQSSTSLDAQKSSESSPIGKKTSLSSGPDTEAKTVVVETTKDDVGERTTTTTTVEETAVNPVENGESVIKKTTTTITKSEPHTSSEIAQNIVEKTTTISRSDESKPSDDPSIVEKETTIIKSETKPSNQDAPSVIEQTTTTIKSEPKPSIDNAPTVVTRTTTTITKSEPKPSNGFVEKTSTTTTKPEPTMNAVSVEKTNTNPATESRKPVDSKTLKETTIKSPKKEERVVVSQTTSEVESIPTTREFLEKNFPEVAILDRPQRIQRKRDDANKPSHFSSQRTTIKEVGDGGNTVKTVTKVVTDDGGTTTTKTTTSSGGNDDHIVSIDSSRKADLPDWLEIKEDDKPKGKAVINDSIKIPSPTLERKERTKPEPSGPAVSEQITPSDNKKEDISSFLDNLSEETKEKPKKKKQAPASKNEDDNLAELMGSLESAPKDQSTPVATQAKTTTQDTSTASATPKTKHSPKERQTAPTTQNAPTTQDRHEKPVGQQNGSVPEKPRQPTKPKPQEKILLDREVKRVIQDGEAIETITETFKDKDGKVETTTTTRKSHQPKEVVDLNANILLSEPIKGTEKKKKYEEDDPFVHDGDVVNPDEVFEEILVVERKRKVRFPKSFVPRTPDRPKSWGLPLDLLVERQKSPRKIPGYIYGREVKENIEETSKNSADLQELDRLLAVIEAAN